MKKSFFKKPKPKRKKAKKFFFFLLFILTVTFTYQFLNHSNIIIDDKELVEVLLSNQTETSVLKKIITTLFPTKKEAIKTLIKANYKGLITEEKEKKTVPTMIKKENSEDIYCAERETQIIKRVQKISDPRITQYAEKLFILIMQLSKDYQKKIIKTKGDNP